MLLDDAELERQLRETLHRAATPVLGEGVDEDAVRQDVERRQSAHQRSRWGGRLFLATMAAAAVMAVTFLVTRPKNDDVEIGPSGDPERVTTTVPELETTVPTTTPTTTEAPTTTTAPSTTAPAQPEFPPEKQVLGGGDHGLVSWGVYLAAFPEGTPEAPQAVSALESMDNAGYRTDPGYTGVNCDEGAADALGIEPQSWVVVVYFETEEQANQAREAFEARGQGVLGIVGVRTYCLD
jgi:hypothetical protein